MTQSANCTCIVLFCNPCVCNCSLFVSIVHQAIHGCQEQFEDIHGHSGLRQLSQTLATSNTLKTFMVIVESPQVIPGCQNALEGIHG